MANNRLDEILQNDAWKFAEFAREVKISPSYLSKIRKQRRTPSESFKRRIVQVLNTSPFRIKETPYTLEDVFPEGTEETVPTPFTRPPTLPPSNDDTEDEEKDNEEKEN